MIVFKVRDRDDRDYDPKKSNVKALGFPSRVVSRKGKFYEIGGEKIELFSTAVMAEAMDRKPQTLIIWEKDGLFPKPVYRLNTDGRHARRLYSGVQVINMHYLVWGKYEARKAATFNSAAFFADTRKVFYAKSLIVDEKGRYQIPTRVRG